MKVQDAVQQQLGFWHGILEGMLTECSSEVLHKSLPDWKANTIAATYTHTVFAEDGIVNGMLQGKTPIYQAEGWQAKTGVAFPGVPPAITPEWSGALKLDLETFKPYAQAVYAATDAYLAGLPDADLDKKMQGPIGETTIGWMITVLLATHYPGHAGEIGSLKGVHGLRGLPF